MKNILYTLFVTAFLICFASGADEPCRKDGKIVVCYWASWAIYRPGAGLMNVTHIDPTLCTHLVYTFAGLDINYNRIASLDPDNDLGGFNRRDSYRQFVELKEQNKCLKTLLAVGGWNEKPRKYSLMAYTPESRKEFATSVVRFLVEHDFDGVDMDWEYPTQRGGIAQDKENFVALLTELRRQLQPWNLMLTVAVAVTRSVVEEAYNIREIANVVDYISLMAYDYTSSESATTGLLAPLQSAGDDIEKSVDLWIAANCPPEKLILGIPMYGRSFKIKNPTKCTTKENCGIGTPTAPNDLQGRFTRQPGFLAFYEVTDELRKYKYQEVLLTKEQTLFAFNGSYWLSYDNEITIAEKVKLAMSKNLGGIMAWSIDTDDFKPISQKTQYPLLKAMNNALDSV